MSDYKLLNHTRKRLLNAQGQLQETSMLNHTWKRLLCSITQERDFYAQGQLQETSFARSLLKETYLNNYKELNKVLNTWYTIRCIHNTIRNRTDSVFLDTWEFYDMNYCKNSLSCWCVCDVLHRECWPFCLLYIIISLVFFKSLSLYIEDLRDVEN